MPKTNRYSNQSAEEPTSFLFFGALQYHGCHMKRLSLIVILLFIASPLFAQQPAPQQGKFKSLDRETGIVTITTAGRRHRVYDRIRKRC